MTTSATATGVHVDRETTIVNHQHLVDQAVGRLVLRKPKVRRLTEIADLLQEGTIGLIRAVDTFSSEHGAKFETWACTCIKNALLEAVRGLGMSIQCEDRDEDQTSPVLDGTAAHVIAPSHDLAIENKIFLEEALPQLPADQRQAIELHFYQDLSKAEVARQMGISPVAVQRLIGRGLAQLKAILEA